jgi:ActD protein
VNWQPVKAVYALFADPDSAQRAVENLRAAGVSDREITVISSEPFEEYEFSHRDRATWIYWIASAGGAVGLCAGYWLTSATARAWPLQTGGMPIVAMWPNLVVIFELTMLFAIVATVVTLLVTAKLPGRRPALYDPEVSNGRILVGVADPRLPIETIERALAVRGGGRLKTIP